MADKARQGTKVDLNTASRDELAAVPGIGASTADAIIAYRKKQGGFKKVDELEHVSGIGKQTLESLRSSFKAGARPADGGNGKAREAAESAADKASAAARKAPETVAAMSPAGPATPPEAAERVAQSAGEMAERGADAARQSATAPVDAMRHTSEQAAEALKSAGEPTARAAETGASMSRRSMESMLASGSSMLGTMREFQEEWLSFWQTQLQESVRAGQQLAGCRTPQDFMEVQAQFTRSSMERFVAEASRLRDLSTRMMAMGFEPLQTAARRNVREAAERARD